MPEIVAIIQTRMSSTRLPGKALLDLDGRSVLSRMVERVKRSTRLTRVVVATTVDPSDDPVEAACLAEKIDVFRGSLPDVLDRYYQAALKYKADVVVRLTGDCPLIDPVLIDDVVNELIASSLQPYLSHRSGRGSLHLCGSGARLAGSHRKEGPGTRAALFV